MGKNKPIYDKQNINIFTIGYTPEGESIVFIVWSGKDILYSYENVIKFIDLLGKIAYNIIERKFMPKDDYSSLLRG